MLHGTAAERGLPVLYHWQAFARAPKDTIRRLADTLTDNTIYCSNPAQFNDPWDCKPHFNTEVLNDPAERQRYFEWALEAGRKSGETLTEEEVAKVRRAFYHLPDRVATMVDRLSQGVVADILDRYRVYCFGTGPTNTLLWSHYADRHCGVCLEFAADKPPLCNAIACRYVDEFPLVRAYEDSELVGVDMLRVKAKVWEYENEYRLITQERTKMRNPGYPPVDDGVFQLQPGVLTSVIVGCQGDYEAVASLVKENAPSVKVKRAVRVPNKFELKIVE